MSSLTANLITADLEQFKSVAQANYNSGQYATVTHYRRVYPHHALPQKISLPTQNRFFILPHQNLDKYRLS